MPETNDLSGLLKMVNQKVFYLKLGFFGIVLAGLIYVWPIFSMVFILLLGLHIFLSHYDRGKCRYFSKIIWLGLFLRLAFTFVAIFYVQLIYIKPEEFPIVMKLVGHSLQLFRDFGREVVNGINIGEFLSGGYGSNSFDDVKKWVAHEGRLTYLHFGAYFQGILNYIFGQSFLNLLIFPFIGTVPIFLVYIIARDFFSEKVALLSSLLVAFLPSNIIWSCTNIRMTVAMSAFLLFSLTLIKFYRRNHIKYIILFVLSLWFIRVSKEKLFEIFLYSSVGLLLWSLSFIQKRKMIIISVLLFAGFWTFMFFPRIQVQLNHVKSQIFEIQTSYYFMPSGNNYRIYDEHVYTNLNNWDDMTWMDIVRGLPKGIAYFMFAPFPWKTFNSLRLFSYPQTILWYFLFPFFLFGLIIGLRQRFDQTMLLMMFVTFWILLLSLVSGNVGTSARHRDLILPLIYIFSSAGILHCLSLFSVTRQETA